MQGIKVPIYVGLAAEDEMVPASLRDDLITWTQQLGVQATVVEYPGMKHGFAARPDTDDPAIRVQYERALSDALSYLNHAR